MKILIIGAGGREHALVQSVKNSPLVNQIFCAPGNDGMKQDCELVPLEVDDLKGLAEFAQKNKIDLTIVGPELPLTLGIVDLFQSQGLKIFGPSKAASQLEASKAFTKDFCKKYNLPTADYETFSDYDSAQKYIQNKNEFPIVIKADGLAAGKGVVVAENLQQAEQALTDMFHSQKFGDAGGRVVVEEFLEGEELSFIVVADGLNYVEFLTSQDHKAALDGDKGPNTGGMGAYSPAPLINDDLRQKVLSQMIEPTLKAMQDEGHPYTGFLYAGLMVSKSGKAKLLEYNCRLGDPETEVLLPLLKSDFVELILAALDHKLDSYKPEFHEGAAVCVVLASPGYPGTYEKGLPIEGLSQIESLKSVNLYHAGTKYQDGQYLTNGGRVLVVSAQAPNLKDAIAAAYKGVDCISWPGIHYRKDIAQKGLQRLQTK